MIKTKKGGKSLQSNVLKKLLVDKTFINSLCIHKNIYLPNNIHASDDENDDKHLH